MFNIEQIEFLKKFILETAKNVAYSTNNQNLYNFATAIEDYDKFCKCQQLFCNSNCRLF